MASLTPTLSNSSRIRPMSSLPLTDVKNINRVPTPRPAALPKLPMQRGHTRSPSPRAAVPFPTISEDDTEEDTSFQYSGVSESTRGREWASEIARRQKSIKDLRDRKIRLEQSQALRTRKASGGSSTPTLSKSSLSYLSSIDAKLSSDDVDFLSALHASVVWRLWHANLTPEVFSAERLLATRLHLVLIRYGQKNIPVSPIVPVTKSHHLMQSYVNRHMMDKDHPDVQSLPQLVAKSMLRQRRHRSRSSTRTSASSRRHVPPSPLSRET